MQKIIALTLFISLFSPLWAQAETVLRTGEEVSVTDDQLVEGDYYVWVGPLGNTSMSGSVAGDMYAFGGTVNVNGTVGEDLTIVGGTAQLNASTSDDLRVVAGEVTIGEHVGGDVFVLAGKLTVLSSATIDGDVFFFGGQGTIAGEVKGSIMGTSEKLRVDAEVGKDINVRSMEGVTLGDRAVVNGKVTYASSNDIVRAQNAVVEGEITKHAYTSPSQKRSRESLVLPFFMSLFAALTAFLLFRKELTVLSQRSYMSPLQSSLFGLVMVLIAPIVSVLLLVTMLGLYVGLTLLAFTILMWVIGYVLAGVVLGAWLSKLFTKKLSVSLLWIIVGTATLHLMLYIPIVGGICVIGIVIMTIGTLAYNFYRSVA